MPCRRTKVRALWRSARVVQRELSEVVIVEQGMSFRVLQLKVGKQDAVQMSLMNDEDLKDYSVLAISEPYGRMINDKIVTSPNRHTHWVKLCGVTGARDWLADPEHALGAD
ncbi:hypothetical protein HIM_11157 [Hirsutella minnesotensis 3608]|uniref:Uncharacterized protein n=1 Tax=Hirsutella minnesotensis 3608 TaxID=1043627 RepID=A0A0F7ZWR9_9HYPO|nr:hypothetical protein HIM_11157 [Hirsutella minnesotensis 3608]